VLVVAVGIAAPLSDVLRFLVILTPPWSSALTSALDILEFGIDESSNFASESEAESESELEEHEEFDDASSTESELEELERELGLESFAFFRFLETNFSLCVSPLPLRFTPPLTSNEDCSTSFLFALFSSCSSSELEPKLESDSFGCLLPDDNVLLEPRSGDACFMAFLVFVIL
jgi:hypothetical protein